MNVAMTQPRNGYKKKYYFELDSTFFEAKLTSCRREAATMCPRLARVLDLLPFDPESGVRVTCDVGYLCANFRLPKPLCSRLMPNVRDRQTDRQTDVRQHHR